ncbi:hypothetical protein NX059_008349 [Plenodomus lindquistii]|nr:hypothetical protein NX059_008349 [Plenodomus lindquistii]
MNQDPTLFFHSGSSTLKPNHITRYEYPHPLHHGIAALYLQAPLNASTRSRPQGRGTFGPNGATFLTITRSMLHLHSATELTSQSAHDKASANPLGRAMARVTKYPGNTVLQSGKFRKRRGFVYVVKRITSIPIEAAKGEGGYMREEAVYEIACSEWRGMRPGSVPGHDSWWQRLHDLYNAPYDRAYWSTRDTMDKYKIPAPLIEWLPRPDIEQAVTIHRQPSSSSSSSSLTLDTPECRLCFRTWYTDSSHPCILPCTHTLCLECLTHTIDNAGYGTFFPNEPDPGRKYWRCSTCRAIVPVLIDRADIIAPDEENFWRYKIARHRLTDLITSWPVVLWAAERDAWCAPLPRALEGEKADPNEVVRARVVCVRLEHAVQNMNALPVFIAGLLDWGYSLDNPVNTAEGDALKAGLVEELRRLEREGRKFHTDELVRHMLGVGKDAVRSVVVKDVEERLGNPVLPPGFEEYRDFLCEWTARGCFMGPTGRKEVLVFMERMRREKVGWWRDVRECWFDRGAPV